MKLYLKIPLIVIIVLIALAGAGLLFLTLAAYHPPAEEEAIQVNTPEETSPFGPEVLRIVNWNIGYAGLGAASDFILDGGVTAKPDSRETVEVNLSAVGRFLAHQDGDVIFLQEVDRGSARTYRMDQTANLLEIFPDYHLWYARNYKAVFVPFPPSDPLGAMDSGLLTMSRFSPTETPRRYQLPGQYSWPVNTVHLKRCALLTRIPSPNPDRQWCLINIHLSAYDDGSLRSEQLGFLKEWILNLYEEGHYVVVGGDWNSLFPGIELHHFAPSTTPPDLLAWIQKIPEKWSPPGWQWVYDAGTSTNRTLEKPFVRGENLESIIDGFLVSPNVSVEEVQGFDLMFKNSDHNPVAVTLKIQG